MQSGPNHLGPPARPQVIVATVADFGSGGHIFVFAVKPVRHPTTARTALKKGWL